jgi:NADH-quinone oxidoreductase subunit C
MTVYTVTPQVTQAAVMAALGDKVKRIATERGEVTVVVSATDYHSAAGILKQAPGCQFEQLMDLCGVDYSEFDTGTPD